MIPPLRRLRSALVLVLAAACAAPAAALAPADQNPEPASGYSARQAVHARHYMAVTANVHATRAAREMLARAGSAVDAAIAAQMVLTLTEPQSSGLGGGAFLLHYAAVDGQVSFFDGRETAPAEADEHLFTQAGVTMRFRDAVNSGRSVGVPGVLRMLELAHRRHGRLPWRDLFQPAIALAENGFVMSPRLAQLIAGNQALGDQPAARAYFFHTDGSPRRAGERLSNPALARTLRTIANKGADAFYQGEIARQVVDAVRQHPVPGALSMADMAAYRAIERDPACAPYRAYTVCSAPPPSAGGLAVLQMLGITARTPLSRQAPDSVDAVHLFSEAGRLAYADRDRYVADPDFIDVPVAAMLSSHYLGHRAALISPYTSMGRAEPGDPVAGLNERRGLDDTPELPSTTHLSIVDRYGDAVSMTSTIEQAFGSKLFVAGFLLNNELTDFSLTGVDTEGRPAANRVQPGKRPRSTMAPTLVLRPQDRKPAQLSLVIGSPGGSAIANYVAQTLIANLDWGLDIQASVSLPHRGSRNGATELERGTPLESLVPALRQRGHHVTLHDFPSGLHGIQRMPGGSLVGGVDPRREGLARGD